jgi:hypothetical protein
VTSCPNRQVEAKTTISVDNINFFIFPPVDEFGKISSFAFIYYIFPNVANLFTKLLVPKTSFSVQQPSKPAGKESTITPPAAEIRLDIPGSFE